MEYDELYKWTILKLRVNAYIITFHFHVMGIWNITNYMSCLVPENGHLTGSLG